MFPRWLGWVFLAFLVYVLYLGNFSRTAPEKPAATADIIPAPTKEKYPALSEFTDKERWQRGLNPGHIGPARWREITPGEGEEAQCGGMLTVKITGLPGTKEETHKLTLGTAPYPVLNTALIGLKPGGVREVSAPPREVYKKPKKEEPPRMVDFTVERLDGVKNSKTP